MANKSSKHMIYMVLFASWDLGSLCSLGLGTLPLHADVLPQEAELWAGASGLTSNVLKKEVWRHFNPDVSDPARFKDLLSRKENASHG